MTTNPTERRDQYAAAMARTDGWAWAAANFSTLSTPASDRYRRIAEAVMAIADAEQAELRRERGLAIAHDRQPYPTAWAYEQACKALRRKAAAIERVLEFAASLDETGRQLAGPDAVHPVAAHIRHLLETPADEEPASPTGQTGLRERIADALADADGWRWAPGCKAESPSYQGYLRCADVVLGVLPPADQAAVLRETDDEGDELVCVDQCGSCDACGMEPFGTPAEGWREAARFLRRTARDSSDRQGALHGARLIEDELRRLADEAQQQPEKCRNCQGSRLDPRYSAGDFACPDCSDGAADEPAAEPQPDNETPDDTVYPPLTTWEIETRRRDNWLSWGTTYDDHDWARERYRDVIGARPNLPVRLICATTTFAVEAEHPPAVVPQSEEA